MTVHDALAAVPTMASGDPVEKDLLHNLLIVRYPYVFGSAEDPSAWDAVDAATGSLPLAIVKDRILYSLDAADSTTVAGVTCIVTNDGKRYKSETVDFDVRSALDKDTTTPPSGGGVAVGDVYLVPAGASGDWGTHPDEIAIYTSRGWVYVAPKIGQLLLLEDESAFYHYTAAGAWAAGIGQSALANSSVLPNHILGGRTHWVIVNQTTNTPPGSPATGDAYIVGGSPTGAWTGHTGKITIYSGTTWLIFAPAEGWTAEDQNLNGAYRYSGSAWVSQRGSVIQAGSSGSIVAPSTTAAGSGNYTISASSAPTLTTVHETDDGSAVTIAAIAGQRIRFTYQLQQNSTVGNVFGLLRDNESAAVDWTAAMILQADYTTFIHFEAIAPDAASHTYKVAAFQIAGGGLLNTFQKSRLSYEVFV